MERILALGGEPNAVPAARRFVARELLGTPAEALTADAALIVAELATNALIHAGPPVTVGIDVGSDVVRLEVHDSSRVAPVQALSGPESMTGRGLALVRGICSRWGCVPVDDGKVVWAELNLATDELTPPAEEAGLPGDQPVVDWPDLAASPEPRYRIELGNVPTDLLLSAKAHVDNLVREFTLAAAGAASGQTAAVSPHLAQLIETVVTRFTEARQAIKRQALVAAAAGEARTRLELVLPLSAAEAARDYLEALDAADAYARAARLLTLETPPQHKAFRRWYVTSLVDQLQRHASGAPQVPPPTFEQHLLGELAVVATARRASERAARLQSVTAALAGASTPEQVAEIVVSEGVAALDASGGGLLLPVDDVHLTVPGSVGYREELLDRLRSERRDAQLPAAEALRTGEPVWLESRADLDARFPSLAGLESGTVSMCALPVTSGGRPLGALRFSFESARLFDDDERRFARALAAQTAQALDRCDSARGQLEARAAAEMAARRLTRLHRVTASLAATSQVHEVAEIVATESAATLGATVSALCLLEEGATLRVVGLHGASPDTERRWRAFGVDENLPASEAVRTNRAVVARTRVEIETRYPAVAGLVPDDRALACVPLSLGDRILGVLSLTFPPEQVLDDAEVEVLTTVGRQCALALERARLFDAERAARDRSTFLGEATGLLTSSLEPAVTVRHLTSLVVPSIADWAVVYLTDAEGTAKPVSVAHRERQVADRLNSLPPSHLIDMDASGGISDVLRTGRSVRYGRVPEEIRAQAVSSIEDPELAEALRPQTGLAVALTARGQVLGALALARTAGDPYSEDDLRLVEEIADRAAVAVANAEQFRRERDAALTLQRSLLPQQIPHVDGVTFAWRYLPGAAGAQTGGDWYDVIPLDDGRVALVIGDVMGRGLQAAAVMGQLRATARAHASGHLGPAEVLALLDGSLTRLEQDQITTALFAVLDPNRGSLTIASAGHLPPLAVGGQDPARFLGIEPGPPLGAGHGEYPELAVSLASGTTLLLFTDGLVEDRSLPVDDGLETLRAAVTSERDPERLCDRALKALGRDTEHDDDTAILAVHLLDRDGG